MANGKGLFVFFKTKVTQIIISAYIFAIFLINKASLLQFVINIISSYSYQRNFLYILWRVCHGLSVFINADIILILFGVYTAVFRLETFSLI